MLCGKTTYVDKSRSSISGHLKYSKRVHVCFARVAVEALNIWAKRIDEFYGPVAKMRKTRLVLIWLC